MFKILQARLQQYVSQELPDVQALFWKVRGTRDQIANIQWIIWKVREFQKEKKICFIHYPKDFDWVDHNKLWKIIQEMGIPDHLTCLLTSLYAGQETSVKIGHGTMNFFRTGKGVCQGSIDHPAYLTDMQRTLCEIPGWIKHKLESRLPGEIPVTSDMQMTSSL